MENATTLAQRIAPLEMRPEDFRTLGYRLIDRIADFLGALPERPVTSGESPGAIREALSAARPLPEHARIPRACSTKPPICCLNTPCSTAIPAFGATSPRQQRPLGRWAICWPLP